MKTLKYLYFLIASVLMTPILKAQETDALNQYLQIAVDNNPSLEASFHRYYAALERVPQVGALPDPYMMLGYYILPIETRVGPRRFDLQLSQSFPWFGTLQAKKDQASKEAEVQYEIFLKMKNELFYQVKAAYYELYAVWKSISITEEYLDILERDERITLNRVEAARASIADVLRIQMEIKENKTQLEFYRDKKQTLDSEFNALLNRSLNEDVILPDSLNAREMQMDYQALIDSVWSNNPELNSLRRQQEALQNKVEVARKSGMPSFGLGISYATVANRQDVEMPVPQDGQDMLMPQATISIPLYRKKYKAMVHEANLQHQSVQSEISNTQNTLQADLVSAINRYRDARRKVSLYEELLTQAQQTLNILTEAYIGGQEDYEEVLRIEQQLLRYQLALENARADFNTSIALVEKLWAKNL